MLNTKKGYAMRPCVAYEIQLLKWEADWSLMAADLL